MHTSGLENFFIIFDRHIRCQVQLEAVSSEETEVCQKGNAVYFSFFLIQHLMDILVNSQDQQLGVLITVGDFSQQSETYVFIRLELT